MSCWNKTNRPRGGAAGLLTALFAGASNDAIMQHAYATPRFLTQQDLIDLMEIGHICEGRRCRAFHLGEPVHIVPATEVSSGFSISLHVDPPSSQLPIRPRTPGHFEDIVLMQKPLGSASEDQAHDHNITSSSNESIPQDWTIDLQRIVHHFADSCEQSRQAEFMFSVYTWFLDHQRQLICREPKIVVLGDDIENWREDLLQPWRHHLDPEAHVFLDLVQPATRRASIEEHLAHIIITQSQTDQSSVLVSMEFVDETAPSVIVRTAAKVPRTCTSEDVVQIVPLLQSFVHNRIDWSHPPLRNAEQQFRTWSGLGLQIKIYAISADVGTTEHINEHATNLPPRPAEGAPFQFNPHALPFQPGIGLPADASEFLQDLHDQWLRVAFAWDTEMESAWFVTWFVDHRYELPRCLVGRQVLLMSDFVNWERTIQATWRDVLDPNLRQERYVVVPQPPQLEEGVAGHIILIQEPREDWITSLVTVFDSFISAREHHMMRLAITTSEHVSLEQIAQQSGYRLIAGQLDPQVPCRGWIDGHPLPAGQRWPGRSGHEITLRIDRQVMRLPVQRADDDQVGFMQTFAGKKIHSDTSARTLHLHPLLWPEEPECLIDLLALAGQKLECEFVPKPSTEPMLCPVSSIAQMKVIRLLAAPQSSVPQYIEVELDADEGDIRRELAAWCDLLHLPNWQWLPEINVMLSLDSWWGKFHFVYLDEDDPPFHYTFHDVSTEFRTEVQHMRWLYAQGHSRAVILQASQAKQTNVHIISFKDQQPTQSAQQARIATPWPARLPSIRHHLPIYHPSKCTTVAPDCSWTIGVDQSQIEQFFKSANKMLCRDFHGLDLPHHVQEALQQCQPLERLDRIVIYTDGSSQPDHRRRPPARVEEEGNGDTWAFLVLGEQYVDDSTSKTNLIGWTAQPVLYNPEAAHYIGSQKVGSETAEREAMFWSGTWRLAQNCNVPTHFCTDSSTAGRQASGLDSASVADTSFYNLRAVYQCLEGGLQQGLAVTHVRGHSQDPWNDLVDILAKQERTKSFYHPRQDLDMRVWNQALRHFWTQFATDVGLPTFQGDAFDVRPPKVPQSVQTPQPVRYHTKQAHLCISLATANVNSLHAGPDGHRGKLQYIRDQMKALHLLFLGIQESRTGEVCSHVDEVLRLGGGADKGHHGVELWINMAQPFAYTGKTAHFLQKQHVVVAYKDPRMILTNISHPMWRAWVVVAHAPQSGTPEQERQTWWESLNAQLLAFVRDDEVYVLLDANAEPGHTDGLHVGPKQTKESKSTKFFREFLETWQLALPATFSCHSGPQETWTTPDGNSQHCIDHVCVPVARSGDCKFSRVVEELDLGNGHLDHNATAVELAWHQLVQLPSTRPLMASVHRESIDGCIHENLAQFAVPAWDQDIHTHIESHNQHVMHCLAKHCRKQPNQAKKGFITSDIWDLRTSKIQCRRIAKSIDQRFRQELLRAAWIGWRAQSHKPPQDVNLYWQVYHPYIVALSCWKLHQGVKLHVLATQLKKALRGARFQAIQSDIEALPMDVAASDVLRTVKKHIGPTNLKCLKKPTLPMLTTPNGQTCVQPEQLRDTWIDFFGQMEGGVRMTWEDLTAKWQDSLAEFQQHEVDLGPADLPSLTDLELSFRRVKKGKALGPDGVPPELCKACPALLARQYFTALMKMIIHGQESLHHKGGTLVPAYKGKGPATDPTSYRSLLISSHMGKVLHRTIRQHQSTMYEQYLCAQQLGGRKKVPVTLGLHEARAFLRNGQQIGHSVGLLMVDLTEAFYRVLRPLAVGGQYSDEQIARIVHKLGMTSDTLHELHEHLRQPSAVDQACLPHHLRQVLRALHTDTYFQIQGQEDCCHTSVGSRPGDCFADVVFSYLFSRVLKSFQQKLDEVGLQQRVAAAPTFDPFGTQDSPAAQVPYLGPVWMDDVCICLTAPTPDGLLRRVGTATSLLLDTMKGYGLTPNLKKGKTELLLSLRGRGVRKCQKQVFGPTASGTMTIICEQEVCHIAVVGQYQHLGGILHHKGDH